MLVLSDDETKVVGKAFDRAWDKFLKKGLLTPHNLHESRHRLARRILRSVFYGERDEWRLARDAVSYVQEVGPGVMVTVAKLRMQRRRRPRRPRRPPAAVRTRDKPTAVVTPFLGDSTPSAQAML